MQPPISQEGYHVMTWNVGHESDFVRTEAMTAPKKKIALSDPEVETFRNQKIKEILYESNFDVCCLQEVGRDEARIRGWVDPARYEILSGDKEDSAVVYDKNKFKLLIQTKSSKEAYYTIVDLQDKESKKIIRVVSAHLSSAGDVEQSDAFAPEEGDKQLKHILETADTVAGKQKPDFVIFGLDANALKTYKGRIGKIEADNFLVDDSNRATCLLLKGSNKAKTAKIDFICAKSFTEKHNVSIERLHEQRFNPGELELGNPQINPSDHKPVMMRVVFKKVPFLKRVKNKLSDL